MQFGDEEFNESVQNRKRMVWIVLMTSQKIDNSHDSLLHRLSQKNTH